MSEYEPTQADLEAIEMVEMSDFDVDYSETEAWVEMMLAGLAESDF